MFDFNNFHRAFQVQIVAPNGTEEPVKIKKLDGHTFECVYVPKVPVSTGLLIQGHSIALKSWFIVAETTAK